MSAPTRTDTTATSANCTPTPDQRSRGRTEVHSPLSNRSPENERDLVLDPLDEYPIDQTPLPMSAVGTSDRHFYDRCYFNAHDPELTRFGDTGFGDHATRAAL
jgi:hypothetical protein